MVKIWGLFAKLKKEEMMLLGASGIQSHLIITLINYNHICISFFLTKYDNKKSFQFKMDDTNVLVNIFLKELNNLLTVHIIHGGQDQYYIYILKFKLTKKYN